MIVCISRFEFLYQQPTNSLPFALPTLITKRGGEGKMIDRSTLTSATTTLHCLPWLMGLMELLRL